MWLVTILIALSQIFNVSVYGQSDAVISVDIEAQDLRQIDECLQRQEILGKLVVEQVKNDR